MANPVKQPLSAEIAIEMLNLMTDYTFCMNIMMILTIQYPKVVNLIS